MGMQVLCMFVCVFLRSKTQRIHAYKNAQYTHYIIDRITIYIYNNGLGVGWVGWYSIAMLFKRTVCVRLCFFHCIYMHIRTFVYTSHIYTWLHTPPARNIKIIVWYTFCCHTILHEMNESNLLLSHMIYLNFRHINHEILLNLTKIY